MWEARNYAMFEGKKMNGKTYKKKTTKTIGQLGKKRVASVWKPIKSLNKSTSIFKLVANLARGKSRDSLEIVTWTHTLPSGRYIGFHKRGLFIPE